jgi:hypothetical protein
LFQRDESIYSDTVPDRSPDNENEEFLELIQDVVWSEAPHDWKRNQIRESADEMSVSLTEKEIDDLLAKNERQRKEKWDATLKQVEKK